MPPRSQFSSEAGSSGKTPKRTPRAVTNAELQAILDWHPLPVNGPDGTTTTRPPADFDKHMHDQLVLKHVILLPSLTHDLPKILDDYFRPETILPSKSGFIDAHTMRTLDNRGVQRAPKEIEVQTRYHSIAQLLVPIASTLALGLSNWKAQCFKWELSAEGVKSAIADGYLKIRPDLSDPSDVKPDKLQELATIAKLCPNAAVWEFKSLNSGKRIHLEDIITLSRETLFPWVKCSGEAGCTVHHITGARMGFDEAPSTCKLPDSLPACPVTAGKRPQYNNRTHAIHILQQAWAEAVRQDATFIILQCGNYEMICYRVRASNTLYVSDVIEVSQKGYGKLQIGLYLAIYRDARARALLVANTETLPESWTRVYASATTSAAARSEKASKVGKRRRKKGLSDVHRLDQQRTVEKGSQEEEIAIVQLKKDGPFLRGPTQFHRVHPGQPPSSGSNPPSPLKPRLFIDIHEELDSPNVFGAVIQMDGTILERDVVVKYAHNDGEYSKLETEFQNYCNLLLKNIAGIPVILGCFTYHQKRLRHMILVMRHAGVRLDQRLKADITLADRMSCARILDGIHQEGYLHGDLVVDKLLISPSIHDIRFVGFGLLRRAGSDKEKMDEFRKLELILEGIQKEHARRVQDGTVKRRHLDAQQQEPASAAQSSATTAVLFGPLSRDCVSKQSPIISGSAMGTGSKTLKVECKTDFIYVEFAKGDREDDEFITRMQHELHKAPHQVFALSQT